MKMIDLYDFFRKIWYPQPEDSVGIQNRKLEKISNLQSLELKSSKYTLDEFIKLKNKVK